MTCYYCAATGLRRKAAAVKKSNKRCDRHVTAESGCDEGIPGMHADTRKVVRITVFAGKLTVLYASCHVQSCSVLAFDQYPGPMDISGLMRSEKPVKQLYKLLPSWIANDTEEQRAFCTRAVSRSDAKADCACTARDRAHDLSSMSPIRPKSPDLGTNETRIECRGATLISVDMSIVV